MTIIDRAGVRASRFLPTAAAAALALGTLAGCSTAETSGASPDRAPEMQQVQGDRFSVSLPGNPERSQHNVGGANTVVHMAEIDDSAFGLSYTDYPKGTTFDLNEGVTGSARGMRGEVASKEPRIVAGKKGLDAKVTGVSQSGKRGQGTAFLTLVPTGTRVYTVLSVVQGGDAAEPAAHDKIVESLTFK